MGGGKMEWNPKSDTTSKKFMSKKPYLPQTPEYTFFTEPYGKPKYTDFDELKIIDALNKSKDINK